MIGQGERRAAAVKAAMRRMILRESSGRIDYVEMVDTDELRPVRIIEDETLVALAVYFGKTRLIDNTVIDAQRRGRLAAAG
jgi:pantoate--beta-alanine ligase